MTISFTDESLFKKRFENSDLVPFAFILHEDKVYRLRVSLVDGKCGFRRREAPPKPAC
jgi:hypothetical protein